MKIYGLQKVRCKVQGHGHECYICVPDLYKKTGRRKAREEGKRQVMQEQEENTLFTMDGTEHLRESETGCCGSFGKKCECGGFMHYQPVYGGYYYKCEACLKETS